MASSKEELDQFSAFVRQRIATNDADASLDELFDLWRSQNPDNDLYAESIAAVNAAIQDYRDGDRGTCAGERSEQLRRELGGRSE